MRRPDAASLAIAGVLAAAIAGPARAAPAQPRPAAKTFPFLADYYKLAAGERSHFALAYRLREKGKREPLGLTLIDQGASTPLPVTPDGWLTHPPSAEALARGAQIRVEAEAGTPMVVSMVPEATLADPAQMQVEALRQASDQVTSVTRKVAGPLSFVAPKFTRVLFSGAEGARGVDAQGREAPLALWRGTPVLDLAAPGAVRSVRFSKAPYHVLLAPPA